MPEPDLLWDITIKIAVEAAGEAEARSLVNRVLAAMEVTPADPPPLVRFDDGNWATEVEVDDPTFAYVEPNDALSVLSCLTVNLDSLTWRGLTDTPFDPESARVAKLDWPPGYWALAGRKETLVHPSVIAVQLSATRRRD